MFIWVCENKLIPLIMLTVNYMILMTIVYNTFGETMQCRVDQIFGEHRILANIKLKEEMYLVYVDTGSPAFWLINKNYTFWKYDHPDNINSKTVLKFDDNGHLITPSHSQIDPPNFTDNPPKYQPDAATDITVHGQQLHTNHISFSDNHLTVIWNIHKEKVTIGQSDFILPIGGVWKIIEKSPDPDFPMPYDGVLGLDAILRDITNKPNFLFSILWTTKIANVCNLLRT